MAAKRTLYIIMALAAIAAFVFSDNGVALFLLVIIFALPLVSLVMLLIAKKRIKFDMSVRESCIRGGALQITMCAGIMPRFFVGSIKIVASIENSTFRKKEYKKFLFNDLSFTPHVYDYYDTDSGRICVRCESLRLVDIFGVFSVKIKCSAYAEATVSPVLYDDIKISMDAGGRSAIYGERALNRKGGDVTEIYNIRDYQAGDPPGAVHWKLSGKFGTLKSKEFGATDDSKLLILADMSRVKYGNTATDAQLNGVLDTAISVSHALEYMGFTHRLGWFDKGAFESTEVCDGDTFVEAVVKLMSIKVNDDNEESLFYLSRTAECSAFTKIVYVSSFVHFNELKNVFGLDVTALEIGDGVGETNEHGVRIINIPYDNIGASLASCEI